MYKPTTLSPCWKSALAFHIWKKMKQNWMSSSSVLYLKNNTGNRHEICMFYAVKNEAAQFLKVFPP